ncbi:hypothetical protein GIB67_006099, partial [Kingdonia uniflora]
TTQAKWLANASDKFVLLLVCLVQEGPSAKVLSTLAMSLKQQIKMGKLKEEYKDLFMSIEGMLHKGDVEYDITLVNG